MGRRLFQSMSEWNPSTIQQRHGIAIRTHPYQEAAFQSHIDPSCARVASRERYQGDVEIIMILKAERKSRSAWATATNINLMQTAGGLATNDPKKYRVPPAVVRSGVGGGDQLARWYYAKATKAIDEFKRIHVAELLVHPVGKKKTRAKRHKRHGGLDEH